MKPICVPCRRFFRMKKSGYYFLEGMPIGNDVLPGNVDAASWKPYKLWVGDQWKCPDCGAEILSGFGRDRIAEHYEEDFAERVQALGADQLQVNDC